MNLLRLTRKKNKKLLVKRTILVFFSLIITVFAWFQFTKILDTNFNFHINSWKIKFIVDGVELPDGKLDININDFYPEMEDKEKIVLIKNEGEVPVEIDYMVTKAIILDQEYDIVESAPEDGDGYYLIPSDRVTRDDGYWEEDVINDERFPFKIKFEIPSANIKPDEQHEIKVIYSWEKSDNATDTKWGHDVAEYLIEARENNRDAYPVEIQIKMFASQAEEKSVSNN